MKAARRARTLGEMRAEALDELLTGAFERHDARIEETAIDLAPGTSYERGFRGPDVRLRHPP